MPSVHVPRGLLACERVTACVCSIGVHCGICILTADTVLYVYKRHISFRAISMSLMDKGTHTLWCFLVCMYVYHVYVLLLEYLAFTVGCL